MKLYSDFWDKPYTGDIPPLPGNELSIAEYERLYRNFNEQALNADRVKQNFTKRLEQRDNLLRSRGITPAGDMYTDEGLKLIDSQIEEINSQNIDDDKLPSTYDIYESLLNDYAEVAGELDRPRPRSNFASLIAKSKVGLADYFDRGQSWKDFRNSILFEGALAAGIFGAEIALGSRPGVGAAAKGAGANLALSLGTKAYEGVYGNREEAEVALGLRPDERLTDELMNATISQNLAVSKGIAAFNYIYPHIRRPGDPYRSGPYYDERVVDAEGVVLQNEASLKYSPKNIDPYSSSESRAKGYASSMGEGRRVITGPKTRTMASDSLKRKNVLARKLEDTENRGSYSDYYRDNPQAETPSVKDTTAIDAAYEEVRKFYSKGAKDAQKYFQSYFAGSTRANEPGRPVGDVDLFRKFIEAGGDRQKRIREFSRKFGEDGSLLGWAFDPKAPLSPDIEERIRTFDPEGIKLSETDVFILSGMKEKRNELKEGIARAERILRLASDRVRDASLNLKTVKSDLAANEKKWKTESGVVKKFAIEIQKNRRKADKEFAAISKELSAREKKRKADLKRALADTAEEYKIKIAEARKEDLKKANDIRASRNNLSSKILSEGKEKLASAEKAFEKYAAKKEEQLKKEKSFAVKVGIRADVRKQKALYLKKKKEILEDVRKKRALAEADGKKKIAKIKSESSVTNIAKELQKAKKDLRAASEADLKKIKAELQKSGALRKEKLKDLDGEIGAAKELESQAYDEYKKVLKEYESPSAINEKAEADYREARANLEKIKKEYGQATDDYRNYKNNVENVVLLKDLPRAKKIIVENFAAYVHKLDIENRIDTVMEASGSDWDLRMNIVDYLDDVGYRTRLHTKEDGLILHPLMKTLSEMKTNVRVDTEMHKNFHKEIMGEYTGDSVAAMLKQSFRKLDDRYKRAFRKYGIVYGDETKHYNPNNWDKNIVAITDKKEFVSDLLTHMDHRETRRLAGLLPQTTMESFAEHAYDGIVANERVPFSGGGKLDIAKRLKQSRIIVWKNGESRYFMMEKYSRAVDPLEMMKGFSFSNANNLAKLEILGNDPKRGIEYLLVRSRERVTELGLKLEKPLSASKLQTHRNRVSESVEELYDILFESVQFVKTPGVAMKLAKTMVSSLRVLKLKFAAITALFCDGITIAMHANIGSGNVWLNAGGYLQVVQKHMKTPGGKKDLELMGIILEDSIRYSEQIYSQSLDFYGKRFIEKAEKLNGVDMLTNFNTSMVEMIVIKKLGDFSKNKWQDLSPVLKREFLEIGLTEREWESVRHLTRKYNGFDVLNPRLASEQAKDSAEFRAARKLQTYVSLTINNAVPGYRPSGYMGFTGKVARGYKRAAETNRPLAYIGYATAGQFAAIINAGSTALYTFYKRYRHNTLELAGAVAFMIFMSMMMVWTKEIANGQVPTNITKLDGKTGKFMLRSLSASGVLNAGQSMALDTLAPEILGVGTGGRISIDVAEQPLAVFRLIKKYAKAENDRQKQAVVNDIITKINPAGTSPFAVLFERMFSDTIIKALDPDAEEYFENKIYNRRKKGTSYYYAPGKRPFDIQERLDER